VDLSCTKTYIGGVEAYRGVFYPWKDCRRRLRLSSAVGGWETGLRRGIGVGYDPEELLIKAAKKRYNLMGLRVEPEDVLVVEEAIHIVNASTVPTPVNVGSPVSK
jgi:hypothetical protein